MKKKIYLFLSIGFLLCFLALSKYEDRASLRSLDFAVSIRVQDAITKYCPVRCDSILSNIGELAGPFLGSIIVIGFTGFFLYDRSKKRLHPWAVLIPIAFVVMTLIEIYGKSVVAHPAPPFFMIKHPTAIFPTYHVSAEYSYPSGHALRAVFMSIFGFVAYMTHMARRKLSSRGIWAGLVCVVFVSLVSLSKIYLGHHWFTDVLGGTFLSCSLAFGALIFAPVDVHAKADYNRKVHE